ncbi:MAG: CDP-alcohol phosphatidyltransferase family protein [Acidobacteriota bacterium]|nr:CDP-alcohol phosphatidyltransferase family protein [Blastocatellia bacterium]MDW8240655.1 CDP-alcohol phosphatidyltransferase family protein [Acidobacteriota bacterium]
MNVSPGQSPVDVPPERQERPTTMNEWVTIANLLTILRMVLIPVFVLLVVYQQLSWALCVWVVAGLTDLFDGLLARKLNQTTSLGVILDPIADKLLVATAFIVLGMKSILSDPIPFWLTVTVISRDVFIVVGALMIFIKTGFRNFRPSWPGKINTVVQLMLITAFLAHQIVGRYADSMRVLYYVAFLMAVFSGFQYIFHATRLLNEQKLHES